MVLAGMIEPVGPPPARLAHELASGRSGDAQTTESGGAVLPRLALWLAEVSAEAALGPRQATGRSDAQTVAGPTRR